MDAYEKYVEHQLSRPDGAYSPAFARYMQLYAKHSNAAATAAAPAAPASSS
eukprot:TRINITY_DN371_c0_g1_i1.p4 TRINITY_DN371_c0_g1~~TRINITY_DN371_c0_g1_i1.p4  ORF type:complete len:51 (+),score=25.11 TRINITY_DN371_c0_g1_i1:226-378(+)